MQVYSYPEHLVSYLDERWPEQVPRRLSREALYDIVAVAFHASFLRDEDRPVRVRLLVAGPDELPESGEAPEGFLRFRLERLRSLTADELRRIGPAAPFETALICVDPGAGDSPGTVWGIAHSGAAWLAPAYGGKRVEQPTHEHLLLHVVAPGRIAAFVGDQFLVELEGGELHDLTHDVFHSSWLPEVFVSNRAEMIRLYQEHGLGIVAKPLLKAFSQQLVQRVLSLLRTARHGGMLLFVERPELGQPLPSCVRVKYGLADEAPRRRHRALLERMLRELSTQRCSESQVVDRNTYASHMTPKMAAAEKDMVELARFIAGLTSVDGAVVLDKRFELLGFGAEVLPQSDSFSVYRALDGEGHERVLDDEETVGTRHRAAYRFAHAHPRGLAVVMSQDGGVRFVTRVHGEITYFEQKLAG